MRCSYSVTLLVAGLALLECVSAHGVMSDPRCRGALKSNLPELIPQVMSPDATIDYCSHCLNAGGVDETSKAGPWTAYAPMTGKRRGGFGLCGDPTGVDDHMRSGIYANPPSFPFVAQYKPGSVANFEVDITTNHNGFFEFYLCDVEKMPGQDISYNGFTQYCHYLERVPHPACEAGTEMDCGPIDPKYPGRWVLPCRTGGNQLVGGDNGKMAYRIPNVQIKVGIVQWYWLSANSCNDPEGFMQQYDYPDVWAGCESDGNSRGAKPRPDFPVCGEPGAPFPEEFWNCADVQVLSDGVEPTEVPTTTEVTEAPTTTEATEAPTTTEATEAPTTTEATEAPTTTEATEAPIMTEPTKASTTTEATDAPTTMPMATTTSSVSVMSSTTMIPTTSPVVVPTEPIVKQCSPTYRSCTSAGGCCSPYASCGNYYGWMVCLPKYWWKYLSQ